MGPMSCGMDVAMMAMMKGKKGQKGAATAAAMMAYSGGMMKGNAKGAMKGKALMGGMKRGNKESAEAGAEKGPWQPSSPVLVGTVTHVDAQKAFIGCPMVKMQYGRDTYAHQRVVEAAQLQVGETVGFELHVNKQGMPQASSPIFKVIGAKNSPVKFAQAVGVLQAPDTEKGHSFVDCPMTKLSCGRDAYCHPKVL